MKTSYKEIVGDLQPGPAIVKLFKEIIYQIKYPEVIATYSLLPHLWVETVPTLFLYGKSGTGKSTAIRLISKLRNAKAFSATNSTMTGLRNYINRHHKQQGNCLLIDNLSARFIERQSIYNFLLTGYDKKASTIVISNTTRGEIMEFDTFCPKVLSSVYGLHIEPRHVELHRRLIIIDFEKLSVPQLKQIDLEGVHEICNSFWKSINQNAYLVLKNKISSYLEDFKEEFTNDTKELFLDLMTTSFASGLFKTIDDTVSYYLDYIYNYLKQQKNILHYLAEKFIKSLVNPSLISIPRLKVFYEEHKNMGYFDEISFKEVKQFFIDYLDYTLTIMGLEKEEK
ncbi:MAG: AAA family ATPase [Candidatus Anstonellales archaeon]